MDTLHPDCHFLVSSSGFWGRLQLLRRDQQERRNAWQARTLIFRREVSNRKGHPSMKCLEVFVEMDVWFLHAEPSNSVLHLLQL